MAKKRKKKNAETSMAYWTLDKTGDGAVFRGERRWWKWPLHKWTLFVLAYAFFGGLTLFFGLVLVDESVYTFDGERIITWEKLLSGSALVLVSVGAFLWFSLRPPRLWEARPGQLSIDGLGLASGQVRALLHEVSVHSDTHADMDMYSKTRILKVHLVLLDGTERRLAGFHELGMDAALGAIRTLGSIAAVRVTSRGEWEEEQPKSG